MATENEGESTPESEAAEEAEWALATAEKLQARGDLEGARTWFRRATEHLFDAGLDDRALVVAKQAAALSELPAAPTSPPPPVVVPTLAPVAAVAPVVTPPPPPAAAIRAPSRATPVPTGDTPVPRAEAPISVPDLLVVAVPRPPPTPPSPPPVPPAPPPPPTAGLRAALVVASPTAHPPATPTALPPAVVIVNAAYDPARAAATDAAASLIAALPLFADLSPERVQSLARESVIVPLHGGAELPLLPPGESAAVAPLWVIIEGQVQLTAGGIPVGALLGAGDFVGELSAYYESGCLFRAEAKGAGRALCVAPTVVQSLARQYDGVRAALEEGAWERSFAALGHASSLLAGVDRAARATLYARFEPVQLAAGDALLTEGEAAAWVWLIAAGSVERYGGALGAKVQRAGAGAAVGVASAWDGAPSGVSVRARRTLLAARLRAEAFRAMVAEFAGLKAARSRADVW